MKIALDKDGIKTGTWNHRVIIHRFEHETIATIHEVYYLEDGSAHLWTSDGKPVSGDTKEDLIWLLDHMRQALDAPWLEEKQVESPAGPVDKLFEVQTGLPATAGPRTPRTPEQELELRDMIETVEDEVAAQPPEEPETRH